MIKHTFLCWKITVSCLDILVSLKTKFSLIFFFLEANKGLTHGLLLISFFDDFSLATPKKRTSHASAPISGNSTEISTKGNKYFINPLSLPDRVMVWVELRVVSKGGQGSWISPAITSITNPWLLLMERKETSNLLNSLPTYRSWLTSSSFSDSPMSWHSNFWLCGQNPMVFPFKWNLKVKKSTTIQLPSATTSHNWPQALWIRP